MRMKLRTDIAAYISSCIVLLSLQLPPAIISAVVCYALIYRQRVFTCRLAAFFEEHVYRIPYQTAQAAQWPLISDIMSILLLTSLPEDLLLQILLYVSIRDLLSVQKVSYKPQHLAPLS